MQLALKILSFATLLFALIPFLKLKGWWIRGFDFPRLQLALLAFALLVADLLLLDKADPWNVAALAGACVAFCIQSSWILPYTRLWRKEAPSAKEGETRDSITLMTANVLQPNKRSIDFLQIVEDHQPDILVVLEANDWWQTQLDPLERNGDYPYSVKHPLDNLYGMLVYSKLPLQNSKTQFLVEDEVPSIHALVQLPSKRKARIHFLHPAPPSPTENTKSSERDAELIMVGKSVARAQLPVIVTGDLNDVAWSATTRLFRKLSRLRDPRIGRGMFNTFNAQRWYLRWPLDHLFCSEHFKVAEIKRLPEFGSDHFPMIVTLTLNPSEDDDASPAPQPSDGEEEWAEETIDEENADTSEVHEPERGHSQ